jgi:hypothetical protein
MCFNDITGMSLKQYVMQLKHIFKQNDITGVVFNCFTYISHIVLSAIF